MTMAEKQVRESELKAANAVSKAKQLFRPSQKAKSTAAAARQVDRDELAAKESAEHMDSKGRKKKVQQSDVPRETDVVHSPAAEQPPVTVATSDISLFTEQFSQATVPLSAELNATEWVVAQLELPSLPANTAGSSTASAGAAASAPAATGSILGGLSGIFAGAAAVGLVAGGGGGKSSAGSNAPVTIATPSTAAPVPTVAASDVIAVFSDKYTNVPVNNWNPNWGQTSTLSDAKAIGGDHIKRVLNLNYQGVQIATLDTNGVATSGVLDVSGKTSVHLDFWLEKSGNFTFKLVSKNGSANAQEAGVLLNGQAGWNSVDIGLDQFTGVDASKIVQMVFESGSVTELHFDNLYFSSTASNYSTGIGGRLVNGYIQNAVVFQDNNGDGILNNDMDRVDEAGEEPYALTGAYGEFNLVGASAKGGSLITVSSSNTIDTSTNEVVTNVFKAPANASVISPLSTLVEAGTKSGLTEAQVKVALGISESTSLLNFDPVQKALYGNADDLAAALVFKTASVMVSNLMDVGSSLIQGAKGADSTDFSSSVVNSLVSKIKTNNNSPLDLADPTTVKSVLSQAVTSSSVSSSTALNAVLEKTASKLVDSNSLLIAQATSSDPVAALEAIAKIEKSVQSTVAASVKDAVKDPSKVQALQDLIVADEADKAEVPKVLKFETLDFEAGSSIKADDFEGASVSPVVQDDGNTVMQFVKHAGKLDANAGVTLSTVTTKQLPTLAPLDFTDTKKLGMWVHSVQAGTKVRLEIGDSASGGYPKDGNWVAAEASTSKAGWEYLTFDFAHPSKRWIANDGKGYEGTTALKDGVTYDMLNVFFDLGSTKLTDQTYYFDGLGYAKSSPGTPPQSIDYQTVPAIPEGYTLAFAEEFGGDIGASSSADKVAPDASHWKLETGAGGWGNGEAQTYTNSLDNAFVQNGSLHIVANKTGDAITSARLKSVPTWEPYGYMEVRAKLPDSQGAWPAIWLLGKDTWPDTGEIDVMEWTKQYFNSSEVQAALHFRGTDNPADNKSAWTYGDTQVKKSTTLSSPITDFHTYQLWWTQDYIRIGVDSNNDNAYFEYRKPANATSANWPY
ncbi:MAG: glycoside hydrolase family 16 protein, partial [Betaproteobacteria bacterium]|nr:glycoside hydrolase family 16 protein [Betaproteobacteria bacterium]